MTTGQSANASLFSESSAHKGHSVTPTPAGRPVKATQHCALVAEPRAAPSVPDRGGGAGGGGTSRLHLGWLWEKRQRALSEPFLFSAVATRRRMGEEKEGRMERSEGNIKQQVNRIYEAPEIC